jgi:hypothetical protein
MGCGILSISPESTVDGAPVSKAREPYLYVCNISQRQDRDYC